MTVIPAVTFIVMEQTRTGLTPSDGLARHLTPSINAFCLPVTNHPAGVQAHDYRQV
ncbi:MAG TPA: hypothetical protein VLH15_10460 [Dehalococcoidales bacterium]|nr:hypothetical protein [Dehalococcoidales bacterium]